MTREVAASKDAPQAVGPYSQACRYKDNHTWYLSGQIPIDPATAKLVVGPAADQAKQCMENLKAVLKVLGLGFDNVVKCTIYLTDLESFADVNQVYGQYFSDPPPARACVQVAALPKGANVEIDAIACL